MHPTALSLRFSIQYRAEWHLGPHSRTRRSAGDAGRWAGGPRFRWFEFGCSAPATSCSVLEPPCPSHNRARHLRSSARRGCPACHHFFFTHVAYAPPLFCWARRHWLHGSPRLILAVLARAFALPKALRRCVPTAKRPPLPPRPTPAAADRPLAAIFHLVVCRVPVAVYTGALIGRPAELHRWAGGSRCLLLQSVCSARASAGNAPEPPCPSHNRVRHLRSSTRPRVPASHRVFFTRVAYASPSPRLALRRCVHGSARLILAVPVRAFALPKSLQLVCAD
jgi:hypothetical protein